MTFYFYMVRTNYLSCALILLVLVFAGCAQRPSSTRLSLPDGQDWRAQEYLRSGNFRAAAEEYLRLERIALPHERYRYATYAAEAYIEARDPARAQHILQSLRVPQSDRDFNAWKQLLVGRAALANRQYAQAVATLSPIDADNVPDVIATQTLRYRALAHRNAGNPIASVRDLVHLDSLLTQTKNREENHRLIWDTLAQTAPSTLATNIGYQNDEVAGWIAAAQLAKSQKQEPSSFQQSLGAWQQRFPRHPALAFLHPETAPIAPPPAPVTVKQIALLLPGPGQFAAAGAAVREGLVSAWYEDRDNPARPALTIREVKPENAAATFREVVNGGAGVVIGPLEKASVSALAQVPSLPVKTIVLNNLDASTAAATSPNLFQFGLAPEDEARQVAEKAWFDGRARALALTPDSPWGQRVYTAFRQQFEGLGGQILAHQAYKNDRNALGQAVEALFPQTAPVPEAVTTQPQPDFVFLAAFPTQARQLRPRFGAVNGINLPVYATSHVYTGSTQPQNDMDLYDVMFCDMPFVLDPARTTGGTPMDNAGAATANTETYARLYALGIDAYRVIGHIDRLQSNPADRYDGVTGQLSIDANGRIKRQLIWAQFVQGTPVSTGPAPAVSE